MFAREGWNYTPYVISFSSTFLVKTGSVLRGGIIDMS
jgi:hypothetical protein